MKIARRQPVLLLASLTAVLIAIIAYAGIRFLFEMGMLDLGLKRGSMSPEESKTNGFYTGAYKPAMPTMKLNNATILNFPHAWAERASTHELAWNLKDVRKPASGYFFYIPMSFDDFTRNTSQPFPFELRLAKSDLEYSSEPGIDYDYTLSSFIIYFDKLPETIHFEVLDRRGNSDNWDNAVTTGTIEYKRAN